MYSPSQEILPSESPPALGAILQSQPCTSPELPGVFVPTIRRFDSTYRRMVAAASKGIVRTGLAPSNGLANSRISPSHYRRIVPGIYNRLNYLQ